MMKRKFVILIVLGLLLASFTVVLAGGDKVQGGTGNGKGAQLTLEKGCEEQPCSEGAPQGQPEEPPQGEVAIGMGPREDAPQGQREDAAKGPTEEGPLGPRDDAPQAPPEEAPQGENAIGQGPPEEALQGPPEAAPQGPPEEPLQGPPEVAPAKGAGKS